MSDAATVTDDRSQFRWCAYWLLIALAVGSMTGRILSVNAINHIKYQQERVKEELRKSQAQWQQRLDAGEMTQERFDRAVVDRRAELEQRLNLERPFLSGNDRSRWNTIRALVDHGTYAIDETTHDPNWDTIDMVKHVGRDGQPHLYSSKPTLLPTLLAGEYWLLQKLTGLILDEPWTLKDKPFEVVRTMLIVTQVPLLAVMFFLIAHLAEMYGRTDWGRIFIVAAATFGTFLTTFAVVLNNHLYAAVSVTIATYAAAQIVHGQRRGWIWFALAGLFGAFAFANELPALSFFALLSAILLWKTPKPALLIYLPAAAVVVAASIGTNWLAHGTVKPPYAMRAEGKDWTDGNWYNYTFERGGRERDSYWLYPERRSKIDQGEASVGEYALQATVGHHGIFSLTPIWLLTIAGLIAAAFKGDRNLRQIAACVALISVVCIAFYLLRPQEDRNYGGMTSGFRWVFWLAPLWLLAMLPAVDWTAAAKWRKAIAGILLALSAMSAAYPTWNPWVLPWPAKMLEYNDVKEF